MHIGINRHIRNRHKKNKNFKPSSKVEVNNWGKDRNVSESGSRWIRRPTSIRQRPGSGPADRLTQTVAPRPAGLQGPCQRAKGRVTTRRPAPRPPVPGCLSQAPSSISVWLWSIKESQFCFFLAHLMFLFSRNITLVVKEPTFSLEYKENFGDLSAKFRSFLH